MGSKIVLLGLMAGTSFCILSPGVISGYPQPQTDRSLALPEPWQVQAVEVPKVDPSALNHFKLAGIRGLSDRDWGCDCRGCRKVAELSGVKLN
jgi:hypothetical protein